MRSLISALVIVFMSALSATAQEQVIRVTVDNFKRAESDFYFAKFEKDGGFGKFSHERQLAVIDHQTVIRLNRDTLYSFGVFDLDAAPVTVTLPDAGDRYMAIQVINEDHYALDVIYKPGPHTFSKEDVGTRYVCFAIRTFVNPNDADDVKKVYALQDALTAKQAKTGRFETPKWDLTSQAAIRTALLQLTAANGGIDSNRMFGRKDQVDEVQHLLGTAAGWGGNPGYAALYSGVVPAKNDGKTAYTLTVKDVPVDGFWSISVYNAEGFFVKNSLNAYTINNVTAKRNAGNSVTIHFGGDEKASNYLPIMPGWNYLARMYRPRKEILDGSWTFPIAEVVE